MSGVGPTSAVCASRVGGSGHALGDRVPVLGRGEEPGRLERGTPAGNGGRPAHRRWSSPRNGDSPRAGAGPASPRSTSPTPTHRYDVTQAPGGGWLPGDSTPTTVYVGKGSAADYAGLNVRGKAVVITHDDAISGCDAAKRALARGAAMLLVANDAPEELIEVAYGPNLEPVDLPVGGGQWSGGRGPRRRWRRQGGPLTVKRWHRLTLDLRPAVPARRSDSRRPDLPPCRGRPGQDRRLATTATVTGSAASSASTSGRHSPYSFRLRALLSVPAGPHRVGQQPGGDAVVPERAASSHGGWSARGDKETFTAGQSGPRAVVQTRSSHPRLGPGFWRPLRQNNFLQINLPSFGDSGRDHTGGMDPSDQTIKLYHGSQADQAERGLAVPRRPRCRPG